MLEPGSSSQRGSAGCKNIMPFLSMYSILGCVERVSRRLVKINSGPHVRN